MEDLGFRLPQSSYEIINNPIDTKLFKYREKPAELRKKILSIRPYASKVYANDITVKCILELSDEPFFNELEFRIIGDGALFEETVEPVRKFSNVIIEQRFLSQTEIAEIHKYYGVFLCPSRMDTQGVSRDEAMSSGLVPITSAVAAIPEFLDSKKGFLIHDENVSEFATAVKTLFQDVATFQQMSRDASISVQNSRSKEIIVKKELLHFQ